MKRASLAMLALPAVVSAQGLLNAPFLDSPIEGTRRVVVDLDGVQGPDVVHYSWSPDPNNTSTIRVGMNGGGGAFTQQAVLPVPPGADHNIAVEDVTGDGVLDIVTALRSANTTLGAGLYIFPGFPGGTTFGNPVHVPLAGTLAAFDFADITGSNGADILALYFDAAINGYRLHWLVSLGGGAFTVQPGVTFPAAPAPTDMLAFDHDGDGTPDALVAREQPARLEVYATQGLALALTPQNVGLGLSTPLGRGILTHGDIAGGPLDDIVFSASDNSGGSTVVVLTNLGAGTFTVGAPQVFAGVTLGEQVLGDWNGDGLLDYARRTPLSSGTVNSSNGLLTIFSGDGAGNFVRRFTMRTGAGAFLFEGSLVDINADGMTDWIGEHEIWFGDGSFASPQVALPITPRAIADIDHDGDPDLLPVTGTETAVNDGQGAFAASPLPLPPPPAGHYYSPLTIADFTGDGRPDVLASLIASPGPLNIPPPLFVEMRMLANNGDGTLRDLGPAAAPGLVIPKGIAADADGDGDLDLLASDVTFRNTGSGFFTGGFATHVGWTPMAGADVDGDSDLDFLARRAPGVTAPANLAILRNVGSTPFIVQPLVTGNGGLALNADSAAFADLDDDGDVDVFGNDLRSSSVAALVIFENVQGAFQLASTNLLQLRLMRTFAATDVDRDGLTDIVHDFFPHEVVVRRRIGPGLVYEPPRRFYGPGFKSVADVDGDGDDDLVGEFVVGNRRFAGPLSGSRRQYGDGTPGRLGIVPTLGATGPFRVGETLTLRVRDAAGGAFAVLGISAAPALLPNTPLPGLTLLIDPITLTLAPFPLVGNPASPGAGRADLSTMISPPLVGQSFYLQSAFLDLAGPALFSQTNGLELTIGL